jgi:hypothetical protein
MPDANDILATVQGYFDALYDGDVAKFRAVFHPQAQLFSAEAGARDALDFDAYMKRVENRPSPKSRQDPRFDRILSFTISSLTTAHVRIKDALLPNRFVDDLLLVKFDSGWRIVCKVWAYDTAKE